MNGKLKVLVHARWFETTILVVILLAGILAGLETSSTLVARHGSLLETLDLVVLAVFLVEIGLKMAAHGRQPWHYFRDGWNVFDFTIVALCCLPMDSPFAAVLRLARGLRLLRLITVLPRLQLLVGALLKSLSAMGYVGLLLALVFYIYGVMGVHLFGPAAPEAFGSLPAAWLSLFRMITLDNWSDLLVAAQRGGSGAALAYFVSFILLGTMIMLNLFIGIVMNSMSEMHAEIAERDGAEASPANEAATLLEELRRMEDDLERLRTGSARLRQRLAAQRAPASISGN
jgi:voltage-gated sodium channel